MGGVDLPCLPRRYPRRGFPGVSTSTQHDTTGLSARAADRLADLRYHGQRATSEAWDLDDDLVALGLATTRDGRLQEPYYVTEPVGCWHPRRPMGDRS